MHTLLVPEVGPVTRNVSVAGTFFQELIFAPIPYYSHSEH